MKVFLNCYNPAMKKEHLSALPEDEVKALMEMSITSQNPLSAMKTPENALREIHYSWFEDSFRGLAPLMQHYVYSSFPADLQERLKELLNLNENKPMDLAKPFKQYFLHRFYGLLEAEKHLPLELLPLSPLNFLSEEPKEQLIALIDLLGIHDMTAEFHQIVSKMQLKKIVVALTAQQQQYLKKILNQQDRYSPPKLGLEVWGGDCDKLQRILHKRGLARLGMALKGQNSDLVWHITRRLDKARGTTLLKYLDHIEPDNVTQGLVQQITNAYKILKP